MSGERWYTTSVSGEGIIRRLEVHDPLKENIVHAEKRFQGAIIDVRYTPAQKSQEAGLAKAEICSALQLIKDHNNGELPDKQLEDLWTEYQCDKD